MFGQLKLPGNILIGAIAILIVGAGQLVANLVKLDQGASYQKLQPLLWSAVWIVIAGSVILLVALIIAIIQHYRR
ncbi:hypothetical protein [Lactiplantibacillus daowaiensis]|uniref:Integral membrane protein n=1 Tax=Lactiplantibacillus daowaiensis TaxID=2559918 RepID=A0ABW1S3Z0_9LACO|nr:hypothetical protein [Lactiplantibacillus daowaiensis]